MEEIVGLKKQVEERDRKIEELRLQLEELSDFVENASIPLHCVNGSGIITWANRAELELMGYSKEDYVGKHISKFHADQEAIEDILDRLIKKETLINYQAKLRSKDGQIRHVLINSNVLWKNGEFVHTRCFTRDISELIREEENKIDLVNTLLEDNRSLKDELKKLKLKLKKAK